MLRVHETAIELVREVAPLAVAIGRCDADLARQLRRALSSVPLNIAEGSDQRGARRASHYSIALGSAREALSALRTAEAWAYIGDLPEDVVARFHEVIGVLQVTSREVSAVCMRAVLGRGAQARLSVIAPASLSRRYLKSGPSRLRR